MSLPYYGGMRHIHTVPGSFDQACGEIRNMNDQEVNEVLDLIYRIKARKRSVNGEVGSPERVVRHVGKFSFNEGERANLLSMVLRAREEGV